MIEQQFGEKELCFRTLDLYTSAVLEASLNPTTPPKPEWREAPARMAAGSTAPPLLLRAPPPPRTPAPPHPRPLPACLP